MASEERLQWKAEITQQIIRENIPGDFVECGVWNGGGSAVQAYYAVPAGRKFHLFDSWQGMPTPTKKDAPSANGVTAESEIGKCVGSIEKVREIFEMVGAASDNVKGYIGWFNETFPQAENEIQQIAMLSLDSDWYESEMLCWKTWWDKVVPGGYVYIDDFHYWPGCRKAAYEFLHDKNAVIHTIGHSAWVKKGERW
jgi:hypothetical protein